MTTMHAPLDQWQARLERHFAGLAQRRAGSGFPIFALEHGLDENELAEISGLLLSRLKAGLPLRSHWLLWVIYATERGYNYDGEEYWRSFEEHTPSWEFGDRYKVVPWFTKFQKAYDGVVPTGPWASHFRIIAWPITHAILPRYLQLQFARALYDLRYRLAGVARFEAASVGRVLAAHAHATTRFEAFLQQEELTGRIVLALLGQEQAGAQQPIYPPTLERIVTDLEQVRSAREWLKATRQEVADRFKGIGHGSTPSLPGAVGGPHGRGALRGEQPNLSIRPNLMLRYSGAGTWSLVMDVPDFRGLAVSADVRAFLKKTRCRLNGADDTKPAGWLLSGRRKAVLKSWPDPEKPLLLFEQSHGVLDHLVESECRLGAGPNWLFRVGQDGIAREITGRIVRPSYEYIIATTAEPPAGHPYVSACSIECAGAKAFRLKMPDAVSAEDAAWLKKLDLQVARTIRVWPAGLPAHQWDGEGNSEWLTTETPCFGITHDHPLEGYCLRLDGGAATIVEAGRVGFPSFFRLPPLPEGIHTLSVVAKPDTAGPAPPSSPPAEGHLVLNVREPESWTPGRPSHAGLIVTVDPHDANLDAFWENGIRLSVLGPESHRVTCEVTLAKSNGEQIFSEQVGDPMSLPVTPENWHRKFDQFLQRGEDYAWRYLEASEGALRIKGDELGEYVVRFEHDALPVRWVIRNHHGTLSARLIDDTGSEQSQPAALFFPFERPVAAEALPPADALSGSKVSAPGGLFTTQHGHYHDAVAVSAGLSGPGLSGLGVSWDFGAIRGGAVTLEQAIRIFALWRSARLAGPLAGVRRDSVAAGILSAIYEMVCGFNWMKAEDALCAAPKSERARDGLQHNIERKNGFGAVLRRDFARIDDGLAQATQWYVELAERYGICKERRLCEFALRLACQPQRLIEVYDRDLDELFRSLRNCPAILRGARMLALLSANRDHDGPALRLPRLSW
ncbi:hypothetical protein [Consotaella salsifontis]|nr:hypothetical protein [Consotaella salsifontis]